MGLAGLGLFVDRVLIGSDMTNPAETSADVVDAFDPAMEMISQDVEPAQVADTVVVELSDKPSLADRLRIVAGRAGQAPSRDAFALPPGWATAPGDDSGVMRPADVQAFRDAHNLDAVMDTGDRMCAVVNGLTLYVGQSIDGYRLKSVRERAAIFEINGVQVELQLNRPTPSS